MRLLLDTHTLLWFLSNDPKLSATAKLAIENLANIRYLSPASLVEIALKVRLGKLKLHAPFASLFPIQLIANDIHLIHLGPERIEPLTPLPQLLWWKDSPWFPKIRLSMPTAFRASGEANPTPPAREGRGPDLAIVMRHRCEFRARAT